MGTTTSLGIHHQAADAVHPHRRGDNVLGDRVIQAPSSGSPPQAWGQLPKHQLNQRVCSRFTPTGVGTTTSAKVKPEAYTGSPPQAWGQQWPCAHVPGWFSVHPHRRGDNAANWDRYHHRNSGSPPQAWGQRPSSPLDDPYCYGSPPQAWGQRRPHPSWPKRWLRFTPTGVGTTGPGSARVVVGIRFTPTGVGTTEVGDG